MSQARRDLEVMGEGGSISFLSVDIANTRPIFRKKKPTKKFGNFSLVL